MPPTQQVASSKMSKKKASTFTRELAMLSPHLPSHSDRDARKRNVGAPHVTPTVASTESNLDSDTDDETPIINLAKGKSANRAALLNTTGGGDVAANLEVVDATNIGENEPIPCTKPPIPKSKGKKSFKAVPPVNVLLPVDVLKGTFENLMICPAIDCPSKADDSTNYHPLKVEHYQYGLATEFYIRCGCCEWGTAIFPQENESKGDSPNPAANSNKKKPERDSEQFHRHAINYAGGFLMQKLGMGMKGLDMVFAFMGIAPNHGSNTKWNRLMNRIGLAEHQVADEVLEENRKLEAALTIEKADDEVLKWLESEDGRTATPETADAKRDQILKKIDGKVGITISGDAGWQKRKIGKNGGDSLTGHNLGVGCLSEKIVAAQSYSQKCRIHQLAKKLGIEPKDHRCPLNFDTTMSSKAMEPVGAVQHCIDIANSVHNVYVDGFVMDDDSTTRANLKHSYAAIIERDNPGTMVNGKIPSRLKRTLGWPVRAEPYELDERGRFLHDGTLPALLTDYGKIPIGIPIPTLFWSDPQHRVRSVGGAFFECRVKNNKATSETDDGLLTEECQNAKRNFGYFLKRNQGYSSDDFCSKAECVLLHLFNIHTKCDEYWCSNLKAKAKLAQEAAAAARARNEGDTNRADPAPSGTGTTNTSTDNFLCRPAEKGNSELTNNNSCDAESSDEGDDFDSDEEDQPVEDLSKYRSLNTKEEKKLYEKVREKVMPLLEPNKMEQVHHPHQTQKNEALQKQMTALCPKDRFFGGTNQIHDRVRLLVVIDSLGEFDGMNRLYHSLGIPPLNNVMGLWAVNRDNKDNYIKEYRKRPEVKRKRAGDKIAAWKEGMRKSKKAKTSGMDYESGIANMLDSNEKRVDVSSKKRSVSSSKPKSKQAPSSRKK